MLKSLLIFFYASAVLLLVAQTRAEDILYRTEQLNSRYHVEWAVDFESREINLTLVVETQGYIGFGLSYTGNMGDADIILGGVHSNGTSYFSDRYGIGETTPIIDEHQDWYLLVSFENSTHTTLQVTRKLETCDEQDIAITSSLLKIIWSIGATDDITYHGGANRGVRQMNMLDPASPELDISQHDTWEVAQPLVLPADDTTHWCTFFKSPLQAKKHHVVAFDIFKNGTASELHTHQVDLYRCTPPPGQSADEIFEPHLGNGYNCYYPGPTDKPPIQYCKLFEMQWSFEDKLKVFPEFMGIPMGDTDESEYFMTEVHYDNPRNLIGQRVHSGLKLYYTDELRLIDAGFIFIGSYASKTYSVTVPPESEEFVVNSHCVPECTSHFPSAGINVFSYSLHAHLSGRKLRVRHYRDGMELPWLANDEHIDFNYPSKRVLREDVKLLPGDQLTLECTYETKWRTANGLNAVTIGGRSPFEEVCQTFLMYYPRQMEVNQCGSYFSQTEMLHYMGITEVSQEPGVNDPTVLRPPNLAGRKYTEVVASLNWTDTMRQDFQERTRFGPQQGYCDPINADEFIMTQYPEGAVEYVPEDEC